MLKGDIVAETKQTIATTSDSQQYGGNKGKIGRDDWDRKGKHNFRYPNLTGHRNEAEGRAIEQSRIRGRMIAPSK